MFGPPQALPIYNLSKLQYVIHELYLTNQLSLLELLNCGTHCHPLLSLNPKLFCHLLNLTSTNLILSPSLLKLPLIFSVFPLSGFVIGPTAFPRHYLLKKAGLSQAVCKNSRHAWYIALYIQCTQLYIMC